MALRTETQLLFVRLDADLIDGFKSSATGYQTRIKATLLEYVQTQQKCA